MRLANKRLLINDRMTPREKVAAMLVTTARCSGASGDAQLRKAAAECELAILPVLERFSEERPAKAPRSTMDHELLAEVRGTIGQALVDELKSFVASSDYDDPYIRIGLSEWLIWAETERRRVTPKGRGRPRKEAIG